MRENEFENLVIPPDIHALKQPDDKKACVQGLTTSVLDKVDAIYVNDTNCIATNVMNGKTS